MALGEAYIDSVELDEIYNLIMKETEEGIQEEVKPSLEQLQWAALSYKTVYEELLANITAFENTLQRQKEIRSGYAKEAKVATYSDVDIVTYILNQKAINNFYESGVPALLYSTTLKFHTILNKFLGQQVQVIYVHEDKNGTPTLYDVIDQQELLRYTYSTNLKVAARFSASAQNFSSALKATQLSDDLNETGLNNLQDAYKASMSRYRRSKVQRAMWLNPERSPKWRVMRIASGGDINEAYATVVLQRQETNFLNTILENNIDVFMMQYVKKVTNEAGSLSGDITIGNIEYAIKSADASVLGITQMIEIADMILQEDFDETAILQKLKADNNFKAKERNVLEETFNNVVDENLDNMIATINSYYQK